MSGARYGLHRAPLNCCHRLPLRRLASQTWANHARGQDQTVKMRAHPAGDDEFNLLCMGQAPTPLDSCRCVPSQQLAILQTDHQSCDESKGQCVEYIFSHARSHGQKIHPRSSSVLLLCSLSGLRAHRRLFSLDPRLSSIPLLLDLDKIIPNFSRQPLIARLQRTTSTCALAIP